MSKTTKIIAALGVVAGLGVAALPAFTYAEETVTGDVQVQAEVVPAIAMTISGNNDGGSHAPVTYSLSDDTEVQSGTTYYTRSGSAGSYVYAAVTDPSGNPHDLGYYVQDAALTYRSVNSFNPSTAASSSIDGHTTPAASITGTSSTYISLLPNAVATGDGTSKFSSTITVYTNNATGYALTLKDKDADTDLVNANGATIPATAATSLTAGTAAWGYKVFSQHGNNAGEGAQATGNTEWLAVPASSASGAAISNLGTKTSGGDQTIVDYGVATAADQATGIYADTIVYTATTNN